MQCCCDGLVKVIYSLNTSVFTYLSSREFYIFVNFGRDGYFTPHPINKISYLIKRLKYVELLPKNALSDAITYVQCARTLKRQTEYECT